VAEAIRQVIDVDDGQAPSVQRRSPLRDLTTGNCGKWLIRQQPLRTDADAGQTLTDVGRDRIGLEGRLKAWPVVVYIVLSRAPD